MLKQLTILFLSGFILSSFVWEHTVTKQEFMKYAEEHVLIPLRKCMGVEFPMTKCYEKLYMEFTNKEDKETIELSTREFVNIHIMFRECGGISHVADARILMEQNKIEMRSSFTDSWKAMDSVMVNICDKNKPTPR